MNEVSPPWKRWLPRVLGEFVLILYRYVGKGCIIEGRGEVIYTLLEHVVRVSLYRPVIYNCQRKTSQNQKKGIFRLRWIYFTIWDIAYTNVIRLFNVSINGWYIHIYILWVLLLLIHNYPLKTTAKLCINVPERYNTALWYMQYCQGNIYCMCYFVIMNCSFQNGGNPGCLLEPQGLPGVNWLR